MEQFDKLRKQLRSENEDLPDGFDWEDMQEGIYDKIDDGADPEPIATAKIKTDGYLSSKIIGGLLLIIIGLSAALIYSYDHPEDSKRSDLVERGGPYDFADDPSAEQDSPADYRQSQTKQDNTTSQRNRDVDLSTNSSKADQVSTEKKISTAESTGNMLDATGEVAATDDRATNTDTDTRNGQYRVEEVKRSTMSEASARAKITSDPSVTEALPTTASTRSAEIESQLSTEENVAVNTIEPQASMTDDHGNIVDGDAQDVSRSGDDVRSSGEEITGTSTQHIQSVDSQEMKPGDGSPGEDGTERPTDLSITATDTKAIVYVEAIQTATFDLHYDRPSITLPQPTAPPSSPAIRPSRSDRWRVELLSGYNVLGNLAKIPTGEPSFYDDISIDHGYSFGLRLQRRINGHVAIESGVDYDRYYQQLETTNISTTPRVLENQILSIDYNAISQSQSTVVGDTAVLDTLIRTLVHHNRLDVISVPLMLRYGKGFGKWRIDGGVGASMTLVRGYDGKYVQDGVTATYDTSSDIYSLGPKFGMLVSASVLRQLTPQWSVGVTADYQRSLSNWALRTDATLMPQAARLRFSIGHTF